MSNDLDDTMARLRRDLAGDGPTQKQIILLKLTTLYENPPVLPDEGRIDPQSPARRWLSAAGALLKRCDRFLGAAQFDNFLGAILSNSKTRAYTFGRVHGSLADAIEALKLELELDGRSEIGNAYEPGDVYRYFADLKAIIAGAARTILVIDPYFDGGAFDAYLGTTRKEVTVSVLAERYADDIKRYAAKHSAQFGTTIEIRRSGELHDRLIIVDDGDCWISGGSIKDAGKKATYLIPLAPQIAEAKRRIYGEVWNRATPLP